MEGNKRWLMERQLASTRETGNEAQAGTTSTLHSRGSLVSLTVELGSSSIRLLVVSTSGDWEWQSDWLVVSTLLDTARIQEGAREGLRRWQLLAMSPYYKQKNGVEPLTLCCMTVKQFEHILA